MSVVLFSTHCPRCNVLEKKLQQKNISYEEVNDVEIMKTTKKINTTHSVAQKLLKKPNGVINATIKEKEFIINNIQRVFTCANKDDTEVYWTLNLKPDETGSIKR